MRIQSLDFGIDTFLTGRIPDIIAHGLSIAGAGPNNYTDEQRLTFIEWLKWFEPISVNLNSIIVRIFPPARRPIFQLLPGLVDGSEGNNDAGLRNAGNTLAFWYLISATVDDFFNRIPDDVRDLGVWSKPEISGGLLTTRGRYN